MHSAEIAQLPKKILHCGSVLHGFTCFQPLCIFVSDMPPYACVAWLTGDVCEYANTHDARKVIEREWHA